MIAATLANMGTNPITGSRVFDIQYIKYVLTVMFTWASTIMRAAGRMKLDFRAKAEWAEASSGW